MSAAIREETELALKNAQGPVTAAATRTLELGIDLGQLERVVQIGATNTCSSFVQRLGRAGRRGTPAEMRFIVRGQVKGGNPFDQINWDLIQNIAIVQLYLDERWVETPREKPCPFSVLFHQTLSVLTQSPLKPSALARRILTLPGMEGVSLEEYQDFLRHAIEHDLIEKMEDGELIIGVEGERLTNSYHFYSVFHDDSGYKVYSKEQELGEIDFLPEIGYVLTLAGRKWQVMDVDSERGCVYVNPTQARNITKWVSIPVGEIDDKVIMRMRRVLEEEQEYGYLQKNAQKHLTEARIIARRTWIISSMVTGEGGHLLLHPWLGVRKLMTLDFLIRTLFKESLGIYRVIWKQFYLEIQYDPSVGNFLEKLSNLLASVNEADVCFDSLSDRVLIKDRYDVYIPRKLLETAYLKNFLDINGLREFWINLRDRVL